MSGLQPAFHWHSATVGADNHFQLVFSRLRPAHACNAHLSWMNNADPPAEHCHSLAHMPKHPFVLITKKVQISLSHLFLISTGLSFYCKFNLTLLDTHTLYASYIWRFRDLGSLNFWWSLTPCRKHAVKIFPVLKWRPFLWQEVAKQWVTFPSSD